MLAIISERHKLKFYLTIIIGSLFFLTLGTAMLGIFLKNYHEGESQAKNYLMPLFAVGVYFMAFYTIYKYYKNAPRIELDKYSISFNDKTFSLADIKRIELTGKRNFRYLIGFPMEAATLTFNSGDTKYIFDDMYENTWQIKSFLQQVIIDKKGFVELENEQPTLAELELESYEIYNGNQLTSLRGISLWGIIGFFAYVLVANKKPVSTGMIVFFFLYSLFWFFLHSWMMHYFKVSQTYFVVKNQNLFWRTRSYRIADINEIVFETRHKMPNCLRVITKDFKSNLYPAATLRDKTWLALKDRLESLGVTVRNECI